MASLRITVEDKRGVTEVYSVVNSISGALENAQLLSRVAFPVRALHQAAKEQTRELNPQQLPAADHELFMCACGDQMFSVSEAIQHVERHHASAEVRADLDQLENTIEALITPNPLTDWDADSVAILETKANASN